MGEKITIPLEYMGALARADQGIANRQKQIDLLIERLQQLREVADSTLAAATLCIEIARLCGNSVGAISEIATVAIMKLADQATAVVRDET